LTPKDYADAAANYIFAKGTEPLAYAAIEARAAKLDPVWHSANTALAGLFFADKSPAIDTAFRAALDDRNIGERVAAPADTTRHLAGNDWVYYGMRYGVYRNVAQSGDPEDYLASGLEGNSSSPTSYVSLAEAYADAKDVPAALREYGHALELAPDTASIHCQMAVLLWSSGRKDEAVNHWKQALVILRNLVDTRVVPETFWIDFATIARDVHQYGILSQMQPSMDAALRAYIAKNGDYRSVELLHSAFIASDSAAHGVDWILSLVDAARNPDNVLAALYRETWLPNEQLGRVLRRELELARAAPQQADDSSSYASDRVARMQLRLLQYLVGEKEDAEAQTLYESIPESQRKSEPIQTIRIVLAARQGRTSSLLAQFSSNPEEAAPMKAVETAASQLRDSGDQADSRLLLEYAFDFKATRHELAETDFLVLAQARLDTGDAAGAIEVLRRMTLFAPDLYSSLDAAAGLLEKSGHFAEALPFLTTLATNTPWKPEYRLRRDRALLRTHDAQSPVPDLSAIGASSEASYSVRVKAASDLKGQGGALDLHSAELVLLASGHAILPAQADQPYFLPSRVAAASDASADARPEILRKAIAVAPSDSLRLEIFRAEFALRHNDLALAAVQPLLDSPGGYVQVANGESFVSNLDVDEANAAANSNANSPVAPSDAETGNDSDPVYASIPVLLNAAKEQVEFALAVSTLYESEGNNEQALSYVRFAERVNREAARRAEIAARVQGLRTRVAIERENSARRPAIHESLDQAVVVRPRIASTASRQVLP